MIQTYSIASDTLNGLVSTSSLDKEIRSSSIVTAIKSTTISSDVLTITFKAALSTEDITILDAVVAAHTGVSDIAIDHVEMVTVMAEGGKRKTDRGFIFTVPFGTTHTHDYLVTADLQIKGGIMHTDNAAILDQVSLEVVDTTYMWAGIWYDAEYAPGISWATALPSGVPLHMYVGNFPVNPTGPSTFDNDAITTTPLNGLTLRVTYKSTGTVDVKCNVGIVAYT